MTTYALSLSRPAQSGLCAVTDRAYSSASAAALTAYLPAHMMYRAAGMKPIFDGFLPTSIGGNGPIMKVDVPLVMMPTMTEIVASAAGGNPYRRPDGDRPGD